MWCCAYIYYFICVLCDCFADIFAFFFFFFKETRKNIRCSRIYTRKSCSVIINVDVNRRMNKLIQVIDMRIIAVLLLSAAIVNAEVNRCPDHCTCKLEGASGVCAFCTQLDPKVQFFNDAIQHLTISNEIRTELKLDDEIFLKLGLQGLESIKIVNSTLRDISVKAFQGLDSLFDVNLSDNELFLIHADTFANNTNLHRLKLSGNPLQLTQLLKTPHEYLLRSSSLTDFDLSNCQLVQILPKTFSQLKNLVFVNLSSNYLKAIPKDVFEGLDSLEDLDLSNNLISKVDPNIFKLNKKNLSVLKLRKNPIERINGIHLPELEELHLNECKLRVIMKETIEGMPMLTTLNLNSNQIEVISDDSFVDLSQLKQLDLSNNKLIGPLAKDLFKNNRNLETLLLSGNKELGSLVEEPGFIDSHLTMTKLELADCGLTSLTAGQLHGMDNLNILNVSNNAISTINSATFAKLRSLNHLDLSNNKLTSLPIALFAMNTDLVKLWLNGNPLKQLPLYMFTYTPNLKFLDASRCGLEKLWDQHKLADGQKLLPRLSFLDMSHNNVTSLHVYDFHTMEALEKVDITGNPIQCVSPTIELIDWFIKKDIDPHHQYEKIQVNGKEEKLKWNDLINTLCPPRDIDPIVATIRPEIVTHTHRDTIVPVVETAQSTFTRVDEIVVEDAAINTSVMWPTIVTASILIVLLYFIIYLVGEITHRRRVAATYTRPGSLGGHARTRGASGSPLYYKLYEECSIPAQPVKTQKNYILDFSPIHTVLKKGTYKIMKTTEVNV